ncbi:MAG: family 20 glycosylhydrolase, partial [Muribaculaceae bacterium]|nr:family 20 glycosylhydrolase [Muribaculaceae bacterium]
MNKFILTFAAAAAIGLSSAKADVTADYRVVPQPRSVEMAAGEAGFTLLPSTKIVYNKSDKAQKRNAELLADYLQKLTGIRPAITTKQARANVIVLTGGLENTNPDAYEIGVTPTRIMVCGASPAGTFNGIQTLRKSIGGQLAEGEKVTFPAATVSDFPEFGYRGMHLDVSRHFINADSVKRYIDILALHNINRLHWHLTDDQGWRLEIKKHPRLTEIGSKRAKTVIGQN